MNNISIPPKYYNSLLLYIINLKGMSSEINNNMQFKDQLNKINELACNCYELLEQLSKQINVFQNLNSLQFELDKINEKYEEESQIKTFTEIRNVSKDLNEINLQIAALKNSVTDYFE